MMVLVEGNLNANSTGLQCFQRRNGWLRSLFSSTAVVLSDSMLSFNLRNPKTTGRKNLMNNKRCSFKKIVLIQFQEKLNWQLERKSIYTYKKKLNTKKPNLHKTSDSHREKNHEQQRKDRGATASRTTFLLPWMTPPFLLQAWLPISIADLGKRKQAVAQDGSGEEVASGVAHTLLPSVILLCYILPNKTAAICYTRLLFPVKNIELNL